MEGRTRRAVVAVRSLIQDAWPIAVGQAATLSLAVWGVTYSEGGPTIFGRRIDSFWLLAAGLGLASLSAFTQYRRRRAASATTAELARALDLHKQSSGALRAVLECEVADLCGKLGLWTSERVTLFVHDGDDLIPAARFSSNAAFRHTGRERYPDSNGCIGRAWQTGNPVVADLPPPTDVDSWLAEQRRWGLTEQTAQALTMKSRSYIAIRIHGLEKDDDALGVLVAESQSPLSDLDGLPASYGSASAALVNYLSGEPGQRLQRYLHRSRSLRQR